MVYQEFNHVFVLYTFPLFILLLATILLVTCHGVFFRSYLLFLILRMRIRSRQSLTQQPQSQRWSLKVCQVFHLLFCGIHHAHVILDIPEQTNGRYTLTKQPRGRTGWIGTNTGFD
jgi:hypothetical protein